MDINQIIKTMHPFEIKILLNIGQEPFSIISMESKTDLKEARARSGINWLEGKNLIEKDKKTVIKKYTVTDKGKEFIGKELIEKVIHQYLNENKNADANDLMRNLKYDKKDIGSAFGFLKKNKEIAQNDKGNLFVTDSFNMDYYNSLKDLLNEFKEKKEILENKLTPLQVSTVKNALQIQLHKGFFKFKESEIYTYKITNEGLQIKENLIKADMSGEEISQITPEMLKEKSWQDKKFREYNINLPAPHILIGKKHPYKEYLDLLKYKFVSLGFQEMRGSLIETEFWNMDALYMPQTHPARDIHDNYFIKEPQYAKSIKEPFFSNVAKTHENGGKTGSKGWGYEFNEETAKRLLLRTQGTVLSARKLASGPEIPGKYFAMTRCFRYDKVDATHLADFFQVEGIVLSEDADFSTLLGLLKLFADEIALAKEVKYVPGYFPFTEPSVEVHIKHPKIGWMEMGGAGIFRPEVTVPLGVDIPVLAWGLGVDRMAMMALGFNDIRDLFSRDLDLIRDTRMVL